MGRLRYALGNIYRLRGQVAHYHNRFDRVSDQLPAPGCLPTTTGGPDGFSIAYIRQSTHRFIADYNAGRIQRPPSDARQMEPARVASASGVD